MRKRKTGVVEISRSYVFEIHPVGVDEIPRAVLVDIHPTGVEEISSAGLVDIYPAGVDEIWSADVNEIWPAEEIRLASVAEIRQEPNVNVESHAEELGAAGGTETEDNFVLTVNPTDNDKLITDEADLLTGAPNLQTRQDLRRRYLNISRSSFSAASNNFHDLTEDLSYLELSEDERSVPDNLAQPSGLDQLDRKTLSDMEAFFNCSL